MNFAEDVPENFQLRSSCSFRRDKKLHWKAMPLCTSRTVNGTLDSYDTNISVTLNAIACIKNEIKIINTTTVRLQINNAPTSRY